MMMGKLPIFKSRHDGVHGRAWHDEPVVASHENLVQTDGDTVLAIAIRREVAVGGIVGNNLTRKECSAVVDASRYSVGRVKSREREQNVLRVIIAGMPECDRGRQRCNLIPSRIALF